MVDSIGTAMIDRTSDRPRCRLENGVSPRDYFILYNSLRPALSGIVVGSPSRDMRFRTSDLSASAIFNIIPEQPHAYGHSPFGSKDNRFLCRHLPTSKSHKTPDFVCEEFLSCREGKQPYKESR